MVRLFARFVAAVVLLFAIWALGAPGRTAEAAGPEGQVASISTPPPAANVSLFPHRGNRG